MKTINMPGLANPEYVREDVELWNRETTNESANETRETVSLYYTEFDKERIAESIARRKVQFNQ